MALGYFYKYTGSTDDLILGQCFFHLVKKKLMPEMHLALNTGVSVIKLAGLGAESSTDYCTELPLEPLYFVRLLPHAVLFDSFIWHPYHEAGYSSVIFPPG